MISVSNAFNTALQSKNRLWKIKATITRNDVGANPIDISDRVITCDISLDWERRNGSASLSIDNYDYSFSPLNTTSTVNQVGGIYNPLFDSNHLIEIYEGLLTSSGYEYVKRFTGVLGDEIDADSYPGIVQLTARDKSKLLQDTYIYQSKSYSPVGATTLPIPEFVIQDLINTFLPSGNITLAVDSPTNFSVGGPNGPYTAKDISLWDAIQQLSDAFNFSVMFDENGILRFKKVVKDLSTLTPVYTFTESTIARDKVATSDSDVRNHVMLRVQGLDPIEKKNLASIQRYGRRYFEVHRSLASFITTAQQGHELVDSILKDLSYVVPVDTLEMALFPLIQAGDIVKLSNAKLGIATTDFTYRVVSVRDSYSKDKKRTSVELRGYNDFNPATVPAPLPPTALNGQTITRTTSNWINSGWTGKERKTYFPLLTWTQPTLNVSGGALTNDFGGYTVYRQGPTDSGFYPIASIKSYIASQNLIVNYFYDYTAITGANQYKISAISRYGTVSTVTSATTITKPADLITP